MSGNLLHRADRLDLQDTGMQDMNETEHYSAMPFLLTAWYKEHKRLLPWREDPDPYHVWVSEIMLQQTRIEAVIKYYYRFMEALPTVEDLSECDTDRLLRLWEGLGYYNRARNLQKAAQRIVTEYGGQIPRTYDELVKLPGFGPYTAGAVASICFQQKVCAIDGNVLRVLARLRGDETNVLDPKAKRQAEAFLLHLMKYTDDPGEFNQALMELGETLCPPKGHAECTLCPVWQLCTACRENLQDQLPVRIKKTVRRMQELTVLVICCDGKFALRRRPEKGLLAGMYELPNLTGHRSAKEAADWLNEQGYRIRAVKNLPAAKHLFTHIEWHMIGFLVILEEISPRAAEEWEWVSRTEERTLHPVPGAYSAYLPYAYET